MKALQTHEQKSAYDSPWSLGTRCKQLLWEYAWPLLCQWTPKPLNFWRLFILRLFGAELHGTPFVHQRARIQQPWKLTMRHRACLGDRATAYTLDRIVIEEGATIAQEAYLCTGTHDFEADNLPLQTAPIHIGKNVFVGVRALVLPGLTLHDRCIIGAGSVVSRSVEAGVRVAGVPARPLKPRPKSIE